MAVKQFSAGVEKRKTFLGSYIPLRHCAFSIKFVLLVLASCLFLSGNLWLMSVLLAAVVIANICLLKKRAATLCKFLILSTSVLLIVWLLFVRPEQGEFGLDSWMKTLRSQELWRAILRLWGMFGVGQLFVGVTTQYELLVMLKRFHAPVPISMFCVLVGNAFACFLQIYREIELGFRMRCGKANPFMKCFHVLSAMVFEAMYLIVGCKKMLFLNHDRVIQSLAKASPEAEFSRDVASQAKELSLNCSYSEVRYPNQKEPVIKRAVFQAKKGDVLFISGPNGCGKTTLLNLISNIIPEIVKAERNGNVEISSAYANQIGYVFQGVENILFFDTPKDLLSHLPQKKLNLWLERFDLSYPDFMCRSVTDFSSGEQQKLSLMSELLSPHRAVCLLDEPTAYLDTNAKAAFFELLKEAKKEKIILIVSHDLECIDHCSRFVQFSDGILLEGLWKQQAEPYRLEHRPAHQELIGTYLLPQEYQGRLPNGRELSLLKGDFLCITGANGSGKTTLAKQIFQVVSSRKGNPVKCAMMMQHSNRQFFRTTVLEELLLGLTENEENRSRAMEYLTIMDLETLAQEAPQFLSGGQQRMLVILCLLMQRPDVLILDEPLNSLDTKKADLLTRLLLDYYDNYSPCLIISDQTNSRFLSFCHQRIDLS